MTPAQKAKELYETYYFYTESPRNSRQCSRIAVDEIIHVLNSTPHLNGKSSPEHDKVWAFWIEVKTELDSL